MYSETMPCPGTSTLSAAESVSETIPALPYTMPAGALHSLLAGEGDESPLSGRFTLPPSSKCPSFADCYYVLRVLRVLETLETRHD